MAVSSGFTFTPGQNETTSGALANLKFDPIKFVDGRTLTPDDSAGINAWLQASIGASENIAKGIQIGASSFSDGMVKAKDNSIRQAEHEDDMALAQEKLAADAKSDALAQAKFDATSDRQARLDALAEENIRSQIDARDNPRSKTPRYLTPSDPGYAPGKLADTSSNLPPEPLGLGSEGTPGPEGPLPVVGLDEIPLVVPTSESLGIDQNEGKVAAPLDLANAISSADAMMGRGQIIEVPGAPASAGALASATTAPVTTPSMPAEPKWISQGKGAWLIEYPDGSSQRAVDDPTKPNGWAPIGGLIKAPGSTGTGKKTESAFDKALATKTANEIVANEGMVAKRQSGLLALTQLLDAGINTGPIASKVGAVGQYFDSNTASNRQEFKSAANEIAKSFRVEGEGSMSDKDFAILVESGPSIDKTEEANRNIISRLSHAATAIQERDKYILDKTSAGVPLRDALQNFIKYAQANPIYNRDKEGNITNVDRPSIDEWESNKESGVAPGAQIDAQILDLKAKLAKTAEGSPERAQILAQAQALIAKKKAADTKK